MSFFRKKFKPIITQNDKTWTDINYKWVIDKFGLGFPIEPIMFDAENFPKTFSESDFIPELAVKDISSFLSMNDLRINVIVIELYNEVKDSYPDPTILTQTSDGFDIIIAQELLGEPELIVANLIIHLTDIYLGSSNLESPRKEDQLYFTYIMSTYLGFGIILAQNQQKTVWISNDIGSSNWVFNLAIPAPVLTYLLGLHFYHVGIPDNRILKTLSKKLKIGIESTIDIIESNPAEWIDKNEILAINNYKKSHEDYYYGEYEKAVDNAFKALNLTRSTLLKFEIYNSIGVYYTAIGDFENSVQYFEEAKDINCEDGRVLDNLAYTFMILGDVKKGKELLDQADLMGNNISEFSLRNLGLYYFLIGDYINARSQFEFAYNQKKIHVLNLDYHYRECLEEIGVNKRTIDRNIKDLNETGEL